MRRLLPFSAFIVAAAIASLPAGAADADLTRLRAEIDALKNDYDARVAALEKRIAELESAQAAAADAATVADVAPPPAASSDAAAPPPDYPVAAPPAPGVGTSAATAFNPAMSVILAGNYAQLSEDPETYHIAGFIPPGGEIGPGERSFNVGESELTFSANIDPYFSGSVTAAIESEGEIAVEEAYFRTLALPAGLLLKGGRFFSGLGYLNEVHAHAWDFIDQPLVYQAFFGGQLAQDGIQLKWLAPTDVFIELGIEAGNGEAFPGTRRGGNGMNTWAALAHIGSDIGNSTSWRAGLSWLNADAEDRTYEDVDHLGLPVENAFTGSSRTWIADAILKWSPQGNSSRRSLEVQGEYMRREEDGDLAFDTSGLGLAGDYDNQQSGWYVQSVYQFIPRWRVGARYDALDADDADIALVDDGTLLPGDFPLLLPASPSRFSLMLDWSPSEFSRLRAQYAWDEARIGDEQDEQFFLQYLYSIGAHGAHKF
jgi:hypothetical protein